MNFYFFSEIESNRFGMKIYRGEYDSFILDDIINTIKNTCFDIIIVRFPTSTIYEHFKLNNLFNCITIHADSLVYYTSSLQDSNIKSLRNNLLFEPLSYKTSTQLDPIVETIFSGYQNHYYSNPILPRVKIIEGYLEWAKSFVKNSENGITWLIKDKDNLSNVAFLACSFDKTEDVSELKLGGVFPRFAGRGIYSDFVRYAQKYFKDMGISTLLTSTQLQNIAVQRVWQKHDFKFEKSYETYHIINKRLWPYSIKLN